MKALTLEAWQDIYGKYEVVYDQITTHRRWSVVHYVVFKDSEGKFWGAYYDVPATEYQSTDDGPIEAFPVEPVKVTITQYLPVVEKAETPGE